MPGISTQSSLPDGEDPFFRAVRTAIREDVSLIVHEEIRRAQLEVERRIKERVDAISLRVLSCYSMERMGTTLRIEVDQSKLGGGDVGREAAADRTGDRAEAVRDGG